MPSLLAFVDPVPSSLATAPLATWQQDCVQAEANWLVIVDDRQRPVGVVSLARLLLLTGQQNTAIPGPEPRSQRRLGSGERPPALPTLLEIAPVLSVDLPLEVAAQTIVGAVDRPWLIIDGQQRYIGRLNGARLLAALRQDPTLAAQPSLAVAATPSTALLTYLGHELKTPLTSLLGLSSLLHTERLGPLSDRQSRYVGLIQQHARRLTTLVNAVLDLGRLESDTLQLMPQIVEVAPLCQEAYRQAHLLIGTDTPLADVDLTALPNRALVADTLRLGQMLTYLMQLTLKTGESPGFPLQLWQWGSWVGFQAVGLGQTVTRLPATQTPGLPTLTWAAPEGIAAGGWLELLLTRRLAQLHGGDLVMAVTETQTLDPILLLPGGMDPGGDPSQPLLLLATTDTALAIAVAQTVRPLGYHLLVAPPDGEILGIAARLQPAAVLMSEAELSQGVLADLKADPQTQGCLTIVLQGPAEQGLQTAPYPPADWGVPWPSLTLTQALQTQPEPPPLPPSRITILYLKSPDGGPDQGGPDLSGLFHDCGCRVLEVDDIDQADLVSRVWQPDVIVLDPALNHPDTYLHGVSRLPHLSQLAVVTLTPEATQLAHGLSNLMVFPCLSGTCSWRQPDQQAQVSTWLMQVLQVVATRKPSGLGQGGF